MAEIPDSVTEQLIEAINGLKNFQKDRDKEKDAKDSVKTTVNALKSNTVAMLGLKAGFMSITSVFKDAAQSNKSIVKQIARQTAGTRTQSNQLIGSIDTGFTTMTEGLETSQMLLEAGLGNMTKSGKEGLIAAKALGLNVQGMIEMSRFNIEALGMSEEAGRDLADSIVESANENGMSTNALISAINSMKTALMKTTVELGPEMSAKVQAVVARMTQGNSEMAAAASRFVTSLVSGEEGFLKAARLGIGFTGGMSEDELAAAVTKAMDTTLALGMGATGKLGAGVHFGRLEASHNITAENFRVAQLMHGEIAQLRQQDMKQAVQHMNQLDLDRQLEVRMFTMQATAVNIQQGIANTLSPLSTWFPAVIALLTAIEVTNGAISLHTAIGAGGGSILGLGGKHLVGIGALLTAAALTANSAMNIINAEPDQARERDIGGTAGALTGAAAGFAIGSAFTPVGALLGAGIGALVGHIGGTQIGKTFESTQNHVQETKELLRDMFAQDEHVGKTTEEVRRLAEERERRARAGAHQRHDVLLKINDVLTRNLMVLERNAGTNRRMLEVQEDAQFSDNTAPQFTTNVNQF